jgi:hypothetical protein
MNANRGTSPEYTGSRNCLQARPRVDCRYDLRHFAFSKHNLDSD